MKNPVLELPAPFPSSLYKNAGLFPGNGGSSAIILPSISVDTISNLSDLPCIALVNLKIGASVFSALKRYCSVGTPDMLALFKGFPIGLETGKPAFIILVNCSNHKLLEGSFHFAVIPLKLTPLLSNIDSLVFTASIFKSPLAA